MRLTVFSSVALMLTLSACTASAPQYDMRNNPSTRAANPASQNCLQNNGRLEIVHGPQGDVGYCVLPGGKRCEEWDMFRGNCPTRTVNVNMKRFGL